MGLNLLAVRAMSLPVEADGCSRRFGAFRTVAACMDFLDLKQSGESTGLLYSILLSQVQFTRNPQMTARPGMKCRILLMGFLMLSPCLAADPGAYPLTVSALQDRYADEVAAHAKYNAYAEKALGEGYPNVAHLFRSLAASEAVHARNFKALLEGLGARDMELPAPEFAIETTRTHLQTATAVEAHEIDTEYPAILGRIRPEHHEEAIKFITYAWHAERQHRDLILKIKSAASRWFGFLIDRIEGDPTRYYVCQICGSTLNEIPAAYCPICGHPVSHYKEVPGYPGDLGPPLENEDF
jgi:rubrerythrin